MAFDYKEAKEKARPPGGLKKKSRSKRPSQTLNPSIPTTPRGGKHMMHDDRMELYRLSARKVAEAGYPATKDRIWDQFVSIAVRSGLRELLEPHKSDPYLSQLRKEGLMSEKEE